MAKRSVSVNTITVTAFNDATNMTSATYPYIVQGGTATQRINVLEIYMGGLSTASTPTIMLLARDSTVGVTNSFGAGQTDAALDASTAALAAPPLTGNTNTTAPQRSTTLHLLNLGFNAFGGIVRWVAPPGEEISLIGNTASLGEVSFSSSSGAGIMGTHLI